MDVTLLKRVVHVCVVLFLSAIISNGKIVWAKEFNIDLLDVRVAAQAKIRIDPDIIVRHKFPDTIFGFNIQHYGFGKDLWQAKSEAVDSNVIDSLRVFSNALYRYPGGLVANRFSWEDSIGPYEKRKVQKSIESRNKDKVLFGVDEYLHFLELVGGDRWYVLNLVGWDENKDISELPADEVADSNKRLAAYLNKQQNGQLYPRYYELGNELDRSKYQWSHKKYIERSRESMMAIKEVDPEARFVAFLRDFDWHYKGVQNQGVSEYRAFIKEVLKELPDINDFSLHFYYDNVGNDKRHKQIPWRLKQFRNAIEVAKEAKEGKPVNVWITEHARGLDLEKRKAWPQRAYTSNLGATLSTGDFLIAIAQIPEIQGACWHGLNAGPWQLFDASIQYNDLRPRPIYWGFRVLRMIDLPMVLGTYTESPNHSNYGGGYDIRAVSFADAKKEKLGLWVVNRAATSSITEIEYEVFRGRSVRVKHYFIAGLDGIEPDAQNISPTVRLEPEAIEERFSDNGTYKIELPPASLSAVMIESN